MHHNTKQNQVKSRTSVDMQIGERISELRTARGLTRKALAESIGITHQQLQKYEKGVNRIAASRLLDVSHSLKTPVSAFFDGSHLTNADYLAEQRLYVDVMRDFSAIKSRSQQEAVRSLIKSLAAQTSA